MKNIVENKVKKWFEKYKYYTLLFLIIVILFLTQGYSKNNINYKLYRDGNEIKLTHGIYTKNQEQYIHIDDLISIFNENIFDDKISGKLIITTYDSIKKISKSNKDYTVKNDDGIYFNLIKSVSDLESKIVVSFDKIYIFEDEYIEAKIKTNRTELYDKQTANVIKHIQKGDNVKIVVNEHVENSKFVDIVVTNGENSYYGYVLKDNIYYEEKIDENESIIVKDNIILVKADEKLLSSTDANYIDMVAINMYRLSGTNTITKLDYTNNVPNGIKVYATVNNGQLSSNYDAELLTRMLNSESNRESIINKLLEETEKLSGVCIDFGKFKVSDKTNFTQFIKELAAMLHANNKEIIVNIPSTQYIDVNAVASVADYIVLQLYTSRTTASKTAGPISSLIYVEDSLKEILSKNIDLNKVVLELPAYSILWTERNGTIINAEKYSMQMIEKYIKANEIKANLDQTSGQNYINFTKGIITYKMWLEDEYSMIQKVKLVKKYNLAGISIYESGMEIKEVYSGISKILNK